MKSAPSYKRCLIYIIPMIVALIARELLYIEWLKSPFRFYHILSGLDMQTFVMRGENFYNGTTSFNMYRFFIAVIYAICGKENLVEGVIAAQMMMGVITTGLTVYLYRHIFRNKIGAMIAGLFCALYTPLMVYETQVLKETLFLFLSILALTLIVFARKKHFPPLPSYIAGAVAIMPFFIRFSGVIWLTFIYFWLITYCYKKKQLWKPLSFAIAGSFTVIILVFSYNLSHNYSILHYFTPNTPYLLGVGATPDAKNLSFKLSKTTTAKVSPQPLFSYIKTYTSKIAYIFSGYEQPNNINYYFTCSKLPLLKFFIGSFVLVPLSVAGLLMMVIYFKKEKRVTIFFLYMIAFIIPMILFLPLARYKMALTPVFAIFAAWWIIYMINLLKSQQKQPIVIPMLIFLSAFLFSGYICRNRPMRNSDKKAYGLAASYLPNKLMIKGRFQEARELLELCYSKNTDNPYIMLDYVSSLLGCGEPVQAEKILLKQKSIQDQILLGRYFYELAECTLILGHSKNALEYYKSALQLPISPQRKKMIRTKRTMIQRALITK